MGKRLPVAMTFLRALFTKPVVRFKDVQTITGLSSKAAYNLIDLFVEKGIIIESTGYQRNRIFVFSDYIAMFKTSRLESTL